MSNGMDLMNTAMMSMSDLSKSPAIGSHMFETSMKKREADRLDAQTLSNVKLQGAQTKGLEAEMASNEQAGLMQAQIQQQAAAIFSGINASMSAGNKDGYKDQLYSLQKLYLTYGLTEEAERVNTILKKVDPSTDQIVNSEYAGANPESTLAQKEVAGIENTRQQTLTSASSAAKNYSDINKTNFDISPAGMQRSSQGSITAPREVSRQEVEGLIGPWAKESAGLSNEDKSAVYGSAQALANAVGTAAKNVGIESKPITSVEIARVAAEAAMSDESTFGGALGKSNVIDQEAFNSFITAAADPNRQVVYKGEVFESPVETGKRNGYSEAQFLQGWYNDPRVFKNYIDGIKGAKSN